MSFDAQLALFLNGIVGQSRFLDGLVIFLASYLGYILVALLSFLLYFSQYQRREKLQIFFVAIISSVIARAGITELIRYLYHRPRPFAELPVNELFTDTAWSFPSGHATFFFALAMAVYLYNKKWGIFFFGAALLITTSRVIAGIHYPSDILGGAVIGIAVACVTFYVAQKMTAQKQDQTS
ncbi:phosphatase PAP2 family protein [Candidatus Kaiserbacteria bacterium]|nr:phosphatase PAP2 family protein [Candidatus Kaiserbacteria bacterium]